MARVLLTNQSLVKQNQSKREITFDTIENRGIYLGDCEIKLLQYADDTTGVLKDDDSLKALIDEIEGFEKFQD